MNAIILSIGDELVLGQTVDTNSAWLSRQLAEVGVAVVAHITVPDDQKSIEDTIRESDGRCNFLIVTGGIGPTEDDLTRQALAAVMGVPLEENAQWMAELHKFFEARGRVMPPINRIQAMIPRGAEMIFNTCGTAAGIHAKLVVIPTSIMQGEPVPVDQLRGRPIGRVLTKMGKITRENVIETLNIQKRDGGLLGQILVGLKYVSDEDLQAALVAQKRLPDDNIATPKASDEYMERMFGKNALKIHRGVDALMRKHNALYLRRKRWVLWIDQLNRSSHGRPTEVFITPGVPKEMKAMFTRDILPEIKKIAGGAVILSRTLHTFGLGESAVAEKLGDLMHRDRNPSVGTTVANGIVSLRLNARFPSTDEAQRELDTTEAACRAALGDLIFGVDDQTLQQVVAKLLNQDDDANANSQTVTTAESCTGGLIAKMLTDVPGSSRFFKQAFVTYSNQAKTEMLGVPVTVIEAHGAVSEQVVRAMATGAKERANADYAMAVSGIAGPDGGTEQKPVGTVWIALAHPAGVDARMFLFPGDREMIRDRSAKTALTMLRFKLSEKPLPF